MIIQGDCLEVLKTLPDCSVQCCVTSPPYYGLRDYGTAKWEGGDPGCDHIDDSLHISSTYKTTDDKREEMSGKLFGKTFRNICKKCGAIRIDNQIGLESTPKEYISKLVEVFREVKRVLRDDGTLWINIGDSYSSGVQRATSCGISDKEPGDYRENDCLCENLCGVCLSAYQNRKSHIDNWLASMITASLSLPIPEHKVMPSDHLPTLDSTPPENRTSFSTRDQESFYSREASRLPAFLESTIGVSFPQLLGVCSQRASRGECLLCGRSFSPDIQRSSHKTACTCGTWKNGIPSNHHNQDTLSLDLAYPDYTINHPKPKDLIGIPWMLAFALRDDGWYLRSEIIWAKPNPMPESVKDRPTKSHEQIFLFAKNQHYYYDAEAVKEPVADVSLKRVEYGFNSDRPSAGKNGIHVETMGRRFADPNGRNQRSVWTVTTKPYREAHFATYPEELITPCILAGTKAGDTVLDPFNGAGTTGVVCQKLGREYIGIELNPKYVELANKRILETPIGMIYDR